MTATCVHLDVPRHGISVDNVPTLLTVEAINPSTALEIDCVEQVLQLTQQPLVLQLMSQQAQILLEPRSFLLETTPTGAIGPQGPQGLPGEGRVEQFITAEAVGGHRVVYFDDAAEGVRLADSTDVGHAFRIAGITLQAVGGGGMVNVRQGGSIQDASFAFTPGEQLFFSALGVLTHTVPVTGFIMPVGYALDTDRIFVEFGLPVFI